jgi:hypothetical protein
MRASLTKICLTWPEHSRVRPPQRTPLVRSRSRPLSISLCASCMREIAARRTSKSARAARSGPALRLLRQIGRPPQLAYCLCSLWPSALWLGCAGRAAN